MTTDPTPRDELATVEADIAELRRGIDELRDSNDGPTDAAEVASTLTAIEEQTALIAALETKRDELRQRLT